MGTLAHVCTPHPLFESPFVIFILPNSFASARLSIIACASIPLAQPNTCSLICMLIASFACNKFYYVNLRETQNLKAEQGGCALLAEADNMKLTLKDLTKAI